MDEYGPLYARVLAGNATGRKILRNMRAISSIPTVTKTSSFLTSRQRSEGQQHLLPLQRQLSIDTMATELRNLLLSGGPFRNDFQQSPRFFPNKILRSPAAKKLSGILPDRIAFLSLFIR